MCGICGVAYADRTRHVDRSRLRAMNKALQHRGPDDSGSWYGGHVALAMRRLSVIDVDAGIGVGFTMFQGKYTDFHMFKVRGGEVHGVHAVLAEAAQSGW